jgi:hypothetical protein
MEQKDVLIAVILWVVRCVTGGIRCLHLQGRGKLGEDEVSFSHFSPSLCNFAHAFDSSCYSGTSTTGSRRNCCRVVTLLHYVF